MLVGCAQTALEWQLLCLSRLLPSRELWDRASNAAAMGGKLFSVLPRHMAAWRFFTELLVARRHVYERQKASTLPTAATRLPASNLLTPILLSIEMHLGERAGRLFIAPAIKDSHRPSSSPPPYTDDLEDCLPSTDCQINIEKIHLTRLFFSFSLSLRTTVAMATVVR